MWMTATEAVTGGSAAPTAAPSALLGRVPLLPAELAAPQSTVCVTGATGFIAGAIIERLLRAGHRVHATCRDPSNQKALAPLLELPGAAERLRLFKADLTASGSFDAAVQGCDFVMHVAAPVMINKVNPREGMVKVVGPMLQGVDNVLGAVDRSPSVRRVVMTSSVAAVCSFGLDPRHNPDAPPTYGPDDWNDAATADALPYFYGKMVSERRAWELAAAAAAATDAGRRWELVTVLPSVVFGPTVAACAASESVEAMRDVWCGVAWPAVGDMNVPTVDTRDVAAVHCLAMFTRGASGRYIAHAHTMGSYEATHVLASRFPNFWPARVVLPYWLTWLVAPLVGINRAFVKAVWGKAAKFDTSRTATDLGFKDWIPLADTLEDMVRDMVAKGLVRMR